MGRHLKFALAAAWLLVSSVLLLNSSSTSADAGRVVRQVVAGYAHTCMLTASSDVECWGAAPLGNGVDNYSEMPKQVVGLKGDVLELAAGGFHACALTAAGAVQCWGLNSHGEIGAPTDDVCGGNQQIPCAMSPVNVTNAGSGAVEIVAGGYHSCLLRSTGEVECWGRNNYGQLGNGTIMDSPVPVLVRGLNGTVLDLTAGTYHTCALLVGGTVNCWGENEDGQLGIGAPDDEPHSTPEQVTNLGSGIVSVRSGSHADHTCAMTAAGGTKCWGANGSGQLGDGTLIDRPAPVQVAGLTTGVTEISPNGLHTCALLASTGVKCWGNNGWQEVGPYRLFGYQTSTPMDVCAVADLDAAHCNQALTDVRNVTAGGFHNCVLPEEGGAQCWGTCVLGQLGTSPCQESGTPRSVAVDSDGDDVIDPYERQSGCMNWKVRDGDLDPDGDLLKSSMEANLVHSNACLMDTDGDGCGDGREYRNVRHPNLPGIADFYDAVDATNHRDGVINLADLLRVASRLYSYGDYHADDGPPPPPPAYYAGYDFNRSGAIYQDDLSLVLSEFGMSCR